jgi:tetratricopeptide (TPR) repeat protein
MNAIKPFLFGLLVIALGPWLSLPAKAQTDILSNSFLSSDLSDDQSREEEIYNDGTGYLDDGKWDRASEKFSEVVQLHGKKTDAALYWKAYALQKLGRRDEALAAVAQLKKDFPRSPWLNDAGALELEVRQAQGKPVDPHHQDDDELKVLALNSLMDRDPKAALPQIEKVLSSPRNSPKVKGHALFVLAQNDSPEAAQILVSVARGQAHPDLQRKAIEYLATNDSAQHMAALSEVYRSSADRDVRRAVLNAYVVCSCQKELMAAAQQERDPDLRRSAIQSLAASGGRDQLRQLYKSSTSAEDKKSIIQGFIVDGDEQGLSEVLSGAVDPAVKEDAIKALGVIGGKNSKATLLQMFGNEKDADIKQAIIQALFIQDAAHELIELDRKEKNPELHHYLVQQLSVMDDKEAKDYMLEILNK